jgi:hypothetical protein
MADELLYDSSPPPPSPPPSPPATTADAPSCDLPAPPAAIYDTIEEGLRDIKAWAARHGYGINAIGVKKKSKKTKDVVKYAFECARSGKYEPWKHNSSKRRTHTIKTGCPFRGYFTLLENKRYSITIGHNEYNYDTTGKPSDLRINRDLIEAQKNLIHHHAIEHNEPGGKVLKYLLAAHPDCWVTKEDVYNEIARQRKVEFNGLIDV